MPVNEAIGTSGSWFDNEPVHTNEIADEVLNDDSQKPMPDIVVTDNPKAMKYVNILISQLNKRCGWKCYYNDMFVNFGGRKGIVITDQKSFGTVGFVPTNNEKGSVFYYFKDYDEESETNNANFLVDCGELGIIQALSIVINYINNPMLYSKPLKEAKKDGFNNDQEAIKSYYSNDWGASMVTDTVRFLHGFKSQVPETVTQEGVKNLMQYFKDNPKVEPWQVFKEIINGTPKGDEFRILCGDSKLAEWKEKGYTTDETGKQVTRKPKTMQPDRWVTVLKHVYADAGGRITENEEVETGTTTTNGEKMTYTAPDGTEFDISFISRCGLAPAKFARLYSRYETLLKELEIDIRDCVKFTKSTRQQKLANAEGLPNAIFVSGIGGIGKSATWKHVRNDMQLKKGFDYEARGNKTVSATALYQWIYENNGMFLVFDDTPDLFNTPFTISLWKAALEDISDNQFPPIGAPQDTQAKYYALKDCMVGGIVSSKKRYLLECPEELTANQIKKLSPEELEKYRKESETVNLPNEFGIESKFLFITNLSEQSLAASVKDSWGAIKSRSVFYKIAPPAAVLWAKIKKTIIQTQDDEEKCWIPKQYVDEVVNFVEKLLSSAETLTFRPFASKRIKRLLLQGRPWKNALTTQITNADFDNDNDDDY
jgi:hypothetical protein